MTYTNEEQQEQSQSAPFDWGSDEFYSNSEPEPTQQFIIQTAIRESRPEYAARVWGHWYDNLAKKVQAGQQISDVERKSFENSLMALPAPEKFGTLIEQAGKGKELKQTLMPTEDSKTVEVTEFLSRPEAKARYLALMLGNFVPINDSWSRVDQNNWHPNEKEMEWLIDKVYELRDFPEVQERINATLKINPDILLRLAVSAVRRSHKLSEPDTAQ